MTIFALQTGIRHGQLIMDNCRRAAGPEMGWRQKVTKAQRVQKHKTFIIDN
jgi:hypothetical protein